MVFWPIIKTAPPATPYRFGADAFQNLGVGVADRPFDTGQYLIPYAPYDNRHLAQGSFNPTAPAHLARANVVDVSLRGSGAYLTGDIDLTGLMQVEQATGVLG